MGRGIFMLTIRNEIQADRQIVEDITCRAFYNLYVPGCGEHCLVQSCGTTRTPSRSWTSWRSWDAIVIFGSPASYVGRGFKSCKKFNVCLERKIPVGHDGERAERGGAGRQEVSVPGQPGDGPRRGGGPALRRHPGAHGAQASAQPGGVLYHEPFLRGRGVSP